jgi:hypothetical protein
MTVEEWEARRDDLARAWVAPVAVPDGG